jgi:uncharacterized 2Fe-2S/4Fe-4S cluster protein (DUF4445 family)
MTHDFPVWLQDQPLVKIIPVALPLPSLSDNSGDVDRFGRTLAQLGFAPVRFSPARMSDLSRKIREHDFRFRAVMGFCDPCWEVLNILPEWGSAPALGFAVDLGTSTLVFRLVDISQRRILSERSVQNPQTVHGEDILSRIFFAGSPTGRESLRLLLLETFAAVMGELLDAHGFSPADVYAVACAGNTAMSHFFLGLDPSNICREPYIPAANTFPIGRAKQFGLDHLSNSLLFLFPNVGSYVGGDIIAGILAAGIHRSRKPQVLIDVGTNAEVILGNSEWLLGCAGAAGPALEGGVVERGMQAFPGAIDRVRIDRKTLEPSWQVIPGSKPLGICGSGLIDLVAELFASGILTVQGKFHSKAASPRIRKTSEGISYAVALGSETDDGREILISEVDIGVFLKSKAAMYTILSLVSAKVGLKFEDIERIYVAGNFGNRIDPEMAIRIGMIPDLPREVYCGIGNASVLGASMVLLDRTLLDQAEAVRSRITYIELNVNLELMNQFRGALFLPHTERRFFPSVLVPELEPDSTRQEG